MKLPRSTQPYISTRAGWLYLAVVMDLYSRRIIGWSMQETMERSLVISALEMALKARRPPPGLLHHSDRGSQYASGDYQELLRQAGCTCSMSRRGNCWDNAPVESFFSTLKMELVHEQRYETRQQARAEIFEFIEVWYNRHRLDTSVRQTMRQRWLFRPYPLQLNQLSVSAGETQT